MTHTDALHSPASRAAVPVVRLSGVGKSFGPVQVLEGIDFDIFPGEVHALVGENGAGKSTLVKIIAGVHAPSVGTLAFDGQETRIRRPAEALARGIVVIHQEFSTLANLTVAENILLGLQPRNRFGLLDWGATRRRAGALLAQLGIALDLRAPVSELSVAERQMIEIAKALAREARLIVFDEPTAVLSGLEAQALFVTIRRMRERGVGIIYISHRLQEVFDLADRATVLKDGRLVTTQKIAALGHRSIVAHMVGRDIQRLYPERTHGPAGEVVLELRGLHLAHRVAGCSLAARRGEILGIAGMAGAGRTELALGMFGALAVTAGEMRLGSQLYRPASPREALAAGVAYLTEDRRAEGLFPNQGVGVNITATTLDQHLRRQVIDRASETASVARWMEGLSIRAAGPRQPIGRLSGGNQQKALFARCLEAKPKVLILDEPTRGVDVGTKSEIYRLIDEIARTGTAVIVISSDLPEVIGLSDRVAVMREGRIAGELRGDDLTEARIVALATLHPIAAGAEVRS